jgi:hypothetical protein
MWANRSLEDQILLFFIVNGGRDAFEDANPGLHCALPVTSHAIDLGTT